MAEGRIDSKLCAGNQQTGIGKVAPLLVVVSELECLVSRDLLLYAALVQVSRLRRDRQTECRRLRKRRLRKEPVVGEPDHGLWRQQVGEIESRRYLGRGNRIR